MTSQKCVTWDTVEMLKKIGAVLEERDGSWMIVEMVNNKVEESMEKQ